MYKEGIPLVPIGDLISRNREKEIIKDDKLYKQVTIKLYGKGVIQRGSELVLGKSIGTKNQYRISEGQFIMSKIDARNGAFGIVPKELQDAITTQDFLSYNINDILILPQFFILLTATKQFNDLCQKASSGTTGRQRVDEKAFLSFAIPVPDKKSQQSIIDSYHESVKKAQLIESQLEELNDKKESLLLDKLGLIQVSNTKNREKFRLENFSTITRWDLWNASSDFETTKYPFQDFATAVIGKPKYGANTKTVKKKSDIRYIRITDINEDGSLNDENVSAEKVDDKYLLKNNDFLIARSGNTVGKTFLYKKEMGKAIYAGYLVKYQLNHEIVNPDYVLFYTKSLPFKKWIESNKRVSAQPNINGQEYLASPIVLPPINIQNEIVKDLDVIYKQIRNSKIESRQMRQNAMLEFESKIFN
ncbi:restriction endonuclease subunit S [Flavobacteriaceae bacterium M23B6Z8]